MRISTRGQYGLRAMCVMAMSAGEGPLPLSDIARREGISLQYLGQLFRSLREAGLVESVRGTKGGYVLARSPDDITVGDVVRAVEGPIAPVECLIDDSEPCERKDFCLTREAWARLRDSMETTLDSITLADLCCGKLSTNSGRKDG